MVKESVPLRPSMDDEPSVDAAYARRLPEFLAIPSSAVVRVNVDLSSAVSILLAAVARARILGPEFARVLRDYDSGLVDAIGDCALALHCAHTALLATSEPVRCPAERLAEAVRLRTLLLRYLKVCADRGLVDPARWSRLHGAHGYLNIATDLGMLVGIIKGTPALAQQSIVSSAELARANELARVLLVTAGKREGRADAVAVAADIRARAFTRVLELYSELRCQVQLVRHKQGDADDFVPTLFGTRKSRRGSKARAAEAMLEGEPVAKNEPSSNSDLGANPELAANQEPRANDESWTPRGAHGAEPRHESAVVATEGPFYEPFDSEPAFIPVRITGSGQGRETPTQRRRSARQPAEK